MAELSGSSAPPAPRQQSRPLARDGAALLAAWKRADPEMSPFVAIALARNGVSPDSQAAQQFLLASAKQRARQRDSGGGLLGRIGSVVSGAGSIVREAADFVTPEAVEDFIGNGPGYTAQLAVRGGLLAFDTAYQTGQGLIRNVATGVNEAAAGALAGAAAGGTIGAGVGLLGGPFAPITSTAGALVGGGIGAVVGGVGTALADPDVEGEADWNVAHWSTGGLAIDAALRGDKVDLGSGWLPSGDIAVEQARRAREQASINGHALTPGRLLAADVVEPGSTAYNIVSGLVDGSIALSPLEPGAALAKGAGVGARSVLRSAGAIDAARRTVDVGQAAGWLASSQGRRVVERIAETNGPEAFNEIWHLTNRRLPARLVLDLADESDPARVAELLRGELGVAVREAPQFPRLPQVNRSLRRVRILQEMPGEHIDTANIDAALRTFDDAQRNARLPESVIALNNRALAEARTPGEMYQVVVERFLNEDLSQQIARHTPDTRRGREMARKLTRAWANHHDELTKYAVDEVGNNMIVPGVVVDGAGKAVASPHLSIEYLNSAIPLPPARDIRRATSTLGRLANNPAIDVPVTYLDSFQQNMWKPMVLLRAAWTVRVVGEEQVRMAASGMSSLFRHPISHIALVVGKRGNIGVEGDDILASAEGIAALAKGSAGWRNRSLIAGKVVFDKDRNPAEYVRGWADELAQLHTDPATKRLAGAVEWAPGDVIGATPTGGAIRATGNHLTDVQEWFWSGKGRYLRNDLDAMGAPVRTRVEADRLVQSWFDRLQTKTGGDPELLDLVATGKIGDADLLAQPGKIGDGVLDALDARYATGPQKVKGDLVLSVKGTAASKASEKTDRAVETLFALLMSRPSNYLSRSPAFRQLYWKRVEELFPYMTEGSQAKAIANAARGKAPNLADLERAAQRGTGDLLSEDVDELAKAFALDETRALLYDLSRRSQFFDVHRLIAPFGEAWKEIITTYGRLGLQQPQVIRRAQQVIVAGRSTEPDDIGLGGVFGHGHAFFYTDAYGDEVLAYPGSEILTEALIGTPVPLTGRLEGLSLGTSVVPGVGPVVQIPAGKLLPETPSWDWVRRIVIPFGDPTTEEGFIESQLPAWLQRLRTSGFLRGVPIVGAEPTAQQERALAGAAFDLLAYQVSSGRRRRPQTMDEVQDAIDENMDAARLLYTIRAAAQFGAPTAPTPEMQVIDRSGNLVVINELRNRYRELVEDEQAGGWATATDRFLETYGEAALLAIQPRSVSTTYGDAVTTEADEWVREHPTIRRRFRNTYGLWAPQGGEFDVTAYSRQFDSGERQGLTSEQMVLFANNRLAQAMYSDAVRLVGRSPNAQQRAILREYREQLASQYPGFAMEIAGVGGRTDIDTAIAELRRGLTVPELAESDAGLGLRDYLAVRDAAQERAEQLGLTTFRGSLRAEPLRLLLRQAADAILAEHPGFGAMWDEVFSREMRDDDEAVAA